MSQYLSYDQAILWWSFYFLFPTTNIIWVINQQLFYASPYLFIFDFMLWYFYIVMLAMM